jgi:hypothetical protein
MSDDLFRALWKVGLDRKQLSIHEMLTDILEVLAVAEGSKPAYLGGQGEGAAWRLDAFARVAATAGLQVLRTAPIGAPSASQWESAASEFPLIAAALERRAAQPRQNGPVQQVLWIYRQPALAARIEQLVAGDVVRLPEVLGYPHCCAEFDARGDADYVRALMRLYETQHGLRDEAAVAAAMEAGLGPVWRTRLKFPYLGHTACPDCLERAAESASGRLDREARALAFRLDEGFGCAVWRAARSEAALATRGHFQALDPLSDDPCPCGGRLRYSACCASRPHALPAFRSG